MKRFEDNVIWRHVENHIPFADWSIDFWHAMRRCITLPTLKLVVHTITLEEISELGDMLLDFGNSDDA